MIYTYTQAMRHKKFCAREKLLSSTTLIHALQDY